MSTLEQSVSTAPTQSMALIFSIALPCTFLSGRKSQTHTKAHAESGSMRRKMSRHDAWLASAPPMTGPMPLHSATMAPRMPWYVPRCRSETTSEMTTCPSVMKPPPPMPVLQEGRRVSLGADMPCLSTSHGTEDGELQCGLR
jgi:hypothetical protein